MIASRFILILLFLISFSLHAQFFYRLEDNYTKTKALVLQVSNKNHWDCFHACAFKFPRILEEAQKEKLPVILIIPEKITDISTIEDNAPIIEGARVALAWASAYFRFKELGNVDVRIIKIPENSEIEVQHAINNILAINICDDASLVPELQIEQRMFAIKDVQNNHNKSEFVLIPFDSQDSCADVITFPSFASSGEKKRILITGGAGFLGSYLARELVQQGHQVIVLDNLSCCSKENINDLMQNKNFLFYEHDVTKPFDVEGQLDIVMHFASVPSPEFYYAMPVQTLRSGLHGTKNTLDLALKKGARYFISSTSEVYGDPEVHPQVEEYPGRVNPIGKRSQYDQSKRGAETLIKLYFDKYHLDIRISRIFNTYGPGMQLNDGRVVTNFIDALLHNKPMKIYGDGNQTRSFCYVSDLIEGMIGLLFSESITQDTPLERRIFNVGNPGEFTVNELAQKVNQLAQKCFNKTVAITHIKNTDLSDPKVRKPDITRINTLTGYQPKVSLDEGLEKTLSYFTKFKN